MQEKVWCNNVQKLLVRLWENDREEEKSPGARALKFVGASDQKIGLFESAPFSAPYIQNNSFIKYHLFQYIYETIFLPCTFCFLLTSDMRSPIVTPPHLLVLFATTFFFHGQTLLDSQSFLQFHDRATLVLGGID